MESAIDWQALFDLATDVQVLIGAIAYLMGSLLILSSIVHARRMAVLASMRQMGEKTVLTLSGMFVAGVFLVYFPSTIQYGGETLFRSNALAYGESAVSMSQTYAPVSVLLRWVEVIGLVSILRGVYLMRHLGGTKFDQHAGGGGKIVIHILLGLGAYNIVYVLNELSAYMPFDITKIIGAS